MKLISIIQEDFVNYRKPSMTLLFPYCSGKCNTKEVGIVCQNESLKDSQCVEISAEDLVQRYLNNHIAKAVVCQGLEPFDSIKDLFDFIKEFRKYSDDDIVIYTGYDADELEDCLPYLATFKNIVVKFGRFKPCHKQHFDNVLGVNLASDNQYAVRLS